MISTLLVIIKPTTTTNPLLLYYYTTPLDCALLRTNGAVKNKISISSQGFDLLLLLQLLQEENSKNLSLSLLFFPLYIPYVIFRSNGGGDLYPHIFCHLFSNTKKYRKSLQQCNFPPFGAFQVLLCRRKCQGLVTPQHTIAI